MGVGSVGKKKMKSKRMYGDFSNKKQQKTNFVITCCESMGDQSRSKCQQDGFINC